MLKRLRLKDFRNYTDLDITFGPKINWIVGPNAIGKTNLLEALSLLSTGRSFRTTSLKELIRHGASAFYIEAEFERKGLPQKLLLFFDGQRKVLKLGQNEHSHFSPLLGILPSTLFTPGCVALISGQPAERRRYLNLQIAQSDPLYVHHLMRFTRALKQRNALLKLRKESQPFSIWENEMARSSHFLMAKRSEVVLGIQEKAAHWLTQLAPDPETLLLSYAPSLPMGSDFAAFFEKTRGKELKVQTTLFGPHRDDLEIILDEKPAKSFASEGQKRTLTAALKLAEWEWMSERLGDVIFCLDDFGAQLDPKRSEYSARLLEKLGQVFVTIPREDLAFDAPESRLHPLSHKSV